MRRPLLLNALVAAVLFVACSPEEQPDMAPSTDLPATEVSLPFPEGELTIDLDFNNKDKVWPFDEACFAKESQRAGGEKFLLGRNVEYHEKIGSVFGSLFEFALPVSTSHHAGT